MNYLLVVITFIVLSGTLAGCAILATDRLIPGRKPLHHISTDGLDLPSLGEQPLILSDHPDEAELKTIAFATAALGYNKEEVDGTFRKLIAENTRLRSQLKQAQASSSES
ncbi:hypothetical protein [Rothia nasimurium]|uniref:hypothetical protein n=1 Tax=Rothia nasimurium TaxID=85336 RepID=UPI003B9E3605